MPVEAKIFFESAAVYSETLSGWALAILGGSALVMLQRAYVRPVSKLMRYAYVLFIVGWCFLARSIYFGTRVHEVQLAFLVQQKPDFVSLRDTLSEDLSGQVESLKFGLWTFGIWLFIYVGWWIWTDQEIKDDS